MQTKTIRGHVCTDRAGVAELLDRSKQTVNNLAADRATTGFPEPWDVDTAGRGVRTRPDGSIAGREWYRLDDIAAFKDVYLARIAETGRARSHGIPLDVDPAAMLTPAAFATLLRIKPDTFRRYVRDSEPAWHAYAIAARHATLDGAALTVHATHRDGRLVVLDEPDEIELGPTMHAQFARYGGTWEPDRPGYTFPRPARDALHTLLTGDDFFLPPPDERTPGKGGIRRGWLGATAAAFITGRHGSPAGPHRRPTAPATP